MDEARLNVLPPLEETVEAVPNDEAEVDFSKTPFALGASGLLLFLPSRRRRPVEELGVRFDWAVAVMDTIISPISPSMIAGKCILI